MSDIIGWVVAGAAALVAALFGGAWLKERKQKQVVAADHRHLAKRNAAQRIAIAELTMRQREQEAIRKQALEGIEDMRRNANSSSPADYFSERFRAADDPEDG